MPLGYNWTFSPRYWPQDMLFQQNRQLSQSSAGLSLRSEVYTLPAHSGGQTEHLRIFDYGKVWKWGAPGLAILLPFLFWLQALTCLSSVLHSGWPSCLRCGQRGPWLLWTCVGPQQSLLGQWWSWRPLLGHLLSSLTILQGVLDSQPALLFVGQADSENSPGPGGLETDSHLPGMIGLI